MRDDRDKWAASQFASLDADDSPPLKAEGIRVQACLLRAQTCVSGVSVLSAFPATGWPDIVNAVQGYAVCLRRDRVLLVNNNDLPKDGWHGTQSIAVSCLLLQRGTEVSLQEPSKSAVRLLFGYEVVLYRIEDLTFRIHVDRAHADALWAHFETTVAALQRS